MRSLPTRWWILETATRQYPDCGGRLHCQYISRRAVVTLDGLLALQLRVRRCVNPDCARFHRLFRPEAEGALALPQQEFGSALSDRRAPDIYKQTLKNPRQLIASAGLFIFKR
jgi:hypothetical protein